MRRRTTLGTLLLLVLATIATGLRPLPAAAAVSVRDALVVDVVDTADANGGVFNATYDSTGPLVPTTAPSWYTPGGLRITGPSGQPSPTGVEVLPADNTRLAVGHYASISGQWNGFPSPAPPRPVPVIQLTAPIGGCTGFVATQNGPSPSWLDVSAVTYDDAGAITSLAASFQIYCQSSAGVATGEIRYQSDADYASVTSSYTSTGDVVAGSRTPVTATVTNRGTVPVTLGAPTATSADPAASLVLTPPGEDCSTAPLAPGATCTLHLEYVVNAQPTGLLALMRLDAPGLTRGFVSVQAAATRVIYPPAPPVALTGDEAYDGVRVRWQRDSDGSHGGMPDGFKVYRVDGPSPVLVATVPIATGDWSDTSLAKGESASYDVAAYNAAGETLTGSPVTLTRPNLPDPPAAVARQVLVVEDLTGAKIRDSAAGDTLTAGPVPLYPTTLELGSTGPGYLTFDTARLPSTPGTYAVGNQPGQIPASLASCSSLTGSVDVREAWIRADLTVDRLDADFHLLCAGTIQYAVQARFGVSTAVSALTTSGTLSNFSATVGQAPDSRVVTLANPGGVPVVIGAPTLSGPDASAFSTSNDTCPTSLDPGATCTVSVEFTPTRSLAHTATLSFDTSTPFGTHSLTLRGTALGPPPVQTPLVSAVLGRAQVRWYAGSDGGSPITGFHVWRAAANGAFSKLADLGAGTYSWVDPDVTPGGTYRYRLVTDNQYGSVTPDDSQTTTVVVPREELIASIDHFDGAPLDLESVKTVADLPVPFGTGQDTDEPAVSPDGRWVAYVVYDAQQHTSLWLRSLDGSAAPRLLVDDPAADELDPAWSPDSTTVAYTRDAGTSTSLWSVSAAPGAGAVAMAGGAAAASPSWLPDGTGVVAVDLTGTTTRLVRITTGGVRTPLDGTTRADSPAVSPRGDQVAYVTTDLAGVDHLWVQPLDGGPAVSVASNVANYFGRPTWAPDGSALAVDQFGPYGGASLTIWRAGTGGLPGTVDSVRVAAGYDVLSPAWRREDVAAPVITFTGAPARTTAPVTIPVQVVDDTVPVGGLAITCTLNGVAVPRCAGAFVGTAQSGSNTLAVTATDGHGHTSNASYTWVADTTPPLVTTSALPAYTLVSPVTFRYGATDDSAVVSYDVRSRSAAWNAPSFSTYAQPATWTATTARSISFGLTPGYEYCLSVRARDATGHVSAWSAEQCTAMPLDDRALRRATAGWASAGSISAYRRTLTGAHAGAQRLDRTGVRVRRVAVVATTCPTCGAVDVYLGSIHLGRLSLTSTRTRTHQVLLLPLRARIAAGTLWLRTLSSRPVLIDGLGLRRT